MSLSNTTLAYTAVNRYADSVGDGVSDWWRAKYFGGPGTTTNSISCAACDPDGDGLDNHSEYIVGTNPISAGTPFRILGISNTSGLSVS